MSTVEDIKIPILVPKRTRKNVKQSKTGCFPCRAQRKKCDETKPACLRCIRSGKKCEGFADNSSNSAISQEETLPLSAPCQSLSIHLKSDSVQFRFAALGIEVLAQQAHQDAFGVGANIWARLLPQLSLTNPTINGAIAALGATYEAVVLRNLDHSGLADSFATIQYHKAIALLRSDVHSQLNGPVPSFLASLLLAAVEVLSRHLRNAAMHLSGALTIMTECIHTPTSSSSASSRSLTPDGSEDQAVIEHDSDILYLMAQALDVQTSTYALSRAPQLPSTFLTGTGPIFGTLSDTFSDSQAQAELIPLLHTCYHYASLAAEYKYFPRAKIPPELALEQSRYIALLSQWNSRVDRRMSTESLRSTTTGSALFVQRIQCISTIIYLSSILNHTEMAYDVFIPFFAQIVDDATFILENQSSGGCLTSPQNRFRFISPLSQPLYLTATKCRQGSIRRRAIHLLGLTGREGPWHGGICQKVAQRVMEIEEDQLLERGTLLIENDVHAIRIPERARLHGTGIESDWNQLSGKLHIEASFSRCVDVELMVTRLDISYEAKENWEIWTEIVRL